jgi:hypothetical protein
VADPRPARQSPVRASVSGAGSAFNVREWLAGLSGCGPDQIAHEREFEEAGQLTVRYLCGETFLAVVNVVGVRQAHGRSARWQLVAQFKDHAVTVVVPGGTRFIWR